MLSASVERIGGVGLTIHEELLAQVCLLLGCSFLIMPLSECYLLENRGMLFFLSIQTATHALVAEYIYLQTNQFHET